VQRYLGSVVTHNDNSFAWPNSAVFTDGSLCCIPKSVHCPLESSTYFPINVVDLGRI